MNKWSEFEFTCNIPQYLISDEYFILPTSFPWTKYTSIYMQIEMFQNKIIVIHGRGG